jgi:hypothetical protein
MIVMSVPSADLKAIIRRYIELFVAEPWNEGMITSRLDSVLSASFGV